MKTIIMKFGGAAVATPEHFARVAEIILKRKLEYPRVVIVVSAMGDTTDDLITLAKKVHPDPPRREYDMLVTVGERISISLLAMALKLRGQDAVSFTGSQSGIITSSDHSNAEILEVRPYRIVKELDAGKVVIVAGFQGVSREGEITTLGRGGSDTTAVAMGIALGAERVEFFKDVPGMFNADPKIDPKAIQHTHLTYEEALEIITVGSEVLHSRCLKLAQKNNIPLCIRSFSESEEKNTGTLIGEMKNSFSYFT